MQTIFVILFISFFVLSVLAYKNPEKFKVSKKGAMLRFGVPTIVLFLAVGLTGGGNSDDPAEASAENEVEPAVEEEEEDEPVIEETEEVDEQKDIEEEPLTPLEIATNTANDVLKDGMLANIEVNNYPENDSKVVLLTINGSDNLTKNMIYKGMLIDSEKIAEAFKNSEIEIHDLMMSWQMPLVDTYGNEEDGEVLRINLSGETLDMLNFDNFLYDNLPSVADTYWEHPTFSN
ncbi:hypothetical protein JOC54_001594 [Alkalihalobacillus xiaoxiensis]|uniref:Uncharacterized protein n=1 Tax=Shouchella xiaoxiensis TaxID=766895 RepID=A0ABS2SS50_9BACI|nr:hypothetical protein [Shouchella xiaoxiensis]MBM7838338.1 hypothetical protein [Shouchella xiaoxiensis]